jgi:hypothetical protein
MTAVDLPLLQQQLIAADVPVPYGLGTRDDTLETVHTFDADGTDAPLPPEADPIVAAHVAPPRAIDYAGAVDVDRLVRTTDDQPVEVFRFATELKHVYRAQFRMTGIDAGNGVTRDSEARMVFKRTAAGLAQVGATAILFNAADAAAASWAILPTVSGTDLVISVRGAVGRSVDWLLVGTVGRYAPDGLSTPPSGPS